MPIFENASNINIFSSTFIDVEAAGAAASGPPEILNQHVAWNALHNSSRRYDPPRCHPETRTAILNRIGRWTTGQAEPILWLNGAAGAGKSAIAQTMAERLQERGVLGASFFFRRDIPGLNTSDLLVSTIAYQLHTLFPPLKSHIFDAVSRDPNIFKKSLKDQFNDLIAHPLKAAQEALPLITVVIDGLDECCHDTSSGLDKGDIQQRLILEGIESICRTSQPLPIRFLISSRPEPQIRTCFQKTSLQGITSAICLNQEPDSNADIGRFLKDKFAEIRQRNPSLDPSWPHDSFLIRIVENSSGHFMYPSTITRHLLSPRTIDPEQSLREILGVTTSPNPAGRPFAALDALYTQILNSIAPESRLMVFDILQLLLDVGGGLRQSHALITHPTMQELHGIECIATILNTSPSHIYTALVDLHSILDIPPFPSTRPIQLIHASLYDFLVDRNRSESFYMGGLLSLRLQSSLLRYTREVGWKSDMNGTIMFLAHVLFCQRVHLLRLALDSDAPLVFRQAYYLLRVRSAEIRKSWLSKIKCFLELALMCNFSELNSSPCHWVPLIMKRNMLIIKLCTSLLLQFFRRPLWVVCHVSRLGLAHFMLASGNVAVTPLTVTFLFWILAFTYLPAGSLTHYLCIVLEALCYIIITWVMMFIGILDYIMVCDLALFIRAKVLQRYPYNVTS